MTIYSKPVVGFHDFLNSRPILTPFRHGLVATPFKLVTDTPGNLAERFRDGELDMALIPSVEYARIPSAVIVPGISIASLGKVETVLLFSEKTMDEIDSVCVDPRSRTSVAMLKILFHELYNGREPTLVLGNDDPESLLDNADAGLVIGDHSFAVDREKYIVYDLGELWYTYSGRPFVHALFCAKRGDRWDLAVSAVREALAVGLCHRDIISKEEKNPLISSEELYHYLTSRILYDLHDEELDGLSHFLGKAKELGLVTQDTLRFYGE